MPPLGDTSVEAVIALRFVRSRAPLSSDDISQGYVRGSHWTDTSSGRTFICASHEAGQASWLEAGATPPPPPATGTLLYAPPGWIGGDPSNPANYRSADGSTFQVIEITGPGTVNLQSGRDYFVRIDAAWSSLPSGRSSITLNGGRHLVIWAPRILFTSTNATDDALALLLHGGDAAGVVHIEGGLIKAPNGITHRTPRLIQVLNTRIVCSTFQDNHSNIHPDVIQVWRDTSVTTVPRGAIRAHRLSAWSTMTYLSDFTDEAGHPLGQQTPPYWELRDVDLHPINGKGLNNWMGYPLGTWRGANLWLEGSTDSAGNVRGLGDQLRQFGGQYGSIVPRDATGISSAQYRLFDAGNALLYTSPFPGGGNPSGSAGRTQGHFLRYVDRSEHPNMDQIEWRWGIAPTSVGADANGNFAPPESELGPAYVSPGYV